MNTDDLNEQLRQAGERQAQAEAEGQRRFDAAGPELRGNDGYKAVCRQLEQVRERQQALYAMGIAFERQVLQEAQAAQFPRFKGQWRGKPCEFHPKFDRAAAVSSQVQRPWQHAMTACNQEVETVRYLQFLMAQTVRDVPQLQDRMELVTVCHTSTYSTQTNVHGYARGHHKPLEQKLQALGFTVHVHYQESYRWEGSFYPGAGWLPGGSGGEYQWWANCDAELAQALGMQIGLNESLAARGTLNPMVTYPGLDAEWNGTRWVV